jgi:hypothetical protein
MPTCTRASTRPQPAGRRCPPRRPTLRRHRAAPRTLISATPCFTEARSPPVRASAKSYACVRRCSAERVRSDSAASLVGPHAHHQRSLMFRHTAGPGKTVFPARQVRRLSGVPGVDFTPSQTSDFAALTVDAVAQRKQENVADDGSVIAPARLFRAVCGLPTEVWTLGAGRREAPPRSVMPRGAGGGWCSLWLQARSASPDAARIVRPVWTASLAACPPRRV